MAETPGWPYGPLVPVLDEADIGVRALGLFLLSVQASGSVPELSLERLLDLIAEEVLTHAQCHFCSFSRFWDGH